MCKAYSIILPTVLLSFFVFSTLSAEESYEERYYLLAFRGVWVPIEQTAPHPGDYIAISQYGSLDLIFEYPEAGIAWLTLEKSEDYSILFSQSTAIGASCSSINAVKECISKHPSINLISYNLYEALDSFEFEKDDPVLNEHIASIKQLLGKRRIVVFGAKIEGDPSILSFPGAQDHPFSSEMECFSNMNGVGIFKISGENPCPLPLPKEMEVISSARVYVVSETSSLSALTQALVNQGVKDLTLEFLYDSPKVDMSFLKTCKLDVLRMYQTPIIDSTDAIDISRTGLIEEYRKRQTLVRMKNLPEDIDIPVICLRGFWRLEDFARLARNTKKLELAYFRLDVQEGEEDKNTGKLFPKLNYLLITSPSEEKATLVFLKQLCLIPSSLMLRECDKILEDLKLVSTKRLAIVLHKPGTLDLSSCLDEVTLENNEEIFVEIGIYVLREYRDFPGKLKVVLPIRNSSARRERRRPTRLTVFKCRSIDEVTIERGGDTQIFSNVGCPFSESALITFSSRIEVTDS